MAKAPILAADVEAAKQPRSRAEKKARKLRKKTRKHRNKAFGDLTAEEKDELLKFVALSLGLVKDDPEP